MAKPFPERLSTGLRSTAQNVPTLRALIAETEAERDRQNEIARQAGADSVDMALDEPDRDDAANRATKAQRKAAGYCEAIETLRGKLAAKLSSDDRNAAEAERAAALAERDELAERIKIDVLDAAERMVEILEATRANAARLVAAGLGGEHNAEALARGVPRHFAHGTAPIDQFTKMRIPARSGPGRQWPVDRAREQAVREAAVRADQHERALAEARRPENVAKREVEEAARYGVYKLCVPDAGRVTFDFTPPKHAVPKRVSLWREPYEALMLHTDAERARAIGLTVEAVEAVPA